MSQFAFEEYGDYSIPFTFELKNYHFNKNNKNEIDMKTNLNNINNKQITIEKK